MMEKSKLEYPVKIPDCSPQVQAPTETRTCGSGLVTLIGILIRKWTC